VSAENDLKSVFGKIKATLGTQAVKLNLRLLAREATSLIQKRTRLGYGVATERGERFRLASIAWTPRYTRFRKLHSDKLDETTTPKKSNLTLTGQMLRSIKVISMQGDNITIGPSGTRKEGGTNREVADGNAKHGRVFMKLSKNEHNQMIRLARRGFSDLMKRLAKIR
jgi:hypothetical protein